MTASPETRQYWLMKSEPSVYGIHDLARDIQAPWDGVRNYQARNFMRDAMQVGDEAIFYHSNANPSAAVGRMRICSEPYPDPTQFDADSEYYDPKASRAQPRWWLVDVCYVETFPQAVSLQQIKADADLADMQVAQKGNRLSIQPVAQRHFDRLLAMAYIDQ